MGITRKGIIMAGGTGKRLRPLTNSISKQLMPVYDKPMLYYPLTTLMLAGIKEFLIISTKEHLSAFKRLLGDGSQWGLSISYIVQNKPNGIAEAFLLGEDFIGNSKVALILGDNLFHSSDMVKMLKKANIQEEGATLFTYRVNDPQNYGVVKIDKSGNPISIVEKPKEFVSWNAITGLYFYDNSVVEKAKKIKPSNRNELEITSINQIYLEEGNLKLYRFNRGSAWLDTGSFDALHLAGSYIRTLERRTGLKVGSPEEVAWRKGWISSSQLLALAKNIDLSGYGDYLASIAFEND
tara:strand:- start:14477 stop:15361 length:885 start_codon:yes stop_codon:yes gene_type:complete